MWQPVITIAPLDAQLQGTGDHYVAPAASAQLTFKISLVHEWLQARARCNICDNECGSACNAGRTLGMPGTPTQRHDQLCA